MNEDQKKQIRDEWLESLQRLVLDVQKVAEHDGWATRVIELSLSDSQLGTYAVPALLLQRAATQAILNPVSRFVPGADGAVDLYRMPAYDDVASLYRKDDQWTIHFDFAGSKVVASPKSVQSRALSEESIGFVLNEIASHAA